MTRTAGSALLFGLALVLAQAGCQHGAAPQAAASSSRAAREVTADLRPAAAADAGGSSYLFGWGEVSADLAEPRGGTTRGAPVTLAPPQTLPLRGIASATSAFTRDRASILALAGDFKVSFHFLETLGLTPESKPGRPYHSWATEHVRVVEDSGRFISLQHTLVMFFRGDDGSISEPMLVKHWRQDWTYEPAELHTFRGERTWERREIAPPEAAGAWSQSVWQVDDSPRYAALGRWSHDGNRAMWTGENTWRPLPRREFSVRDDYDVMEGTHRIVLTPTGWTHEQRNWKRVTGDAAPAVRYLAEEWGLDRYERITAPSLAAADEYWAATGGYWAAVRAAWRDVFVQHDRFTLASEVDGERLFEAHFEYADGLTADGAVYDPVAGASHARATINRFLTAAAP